VPGAAPVGIPEGVEVAGRCAASSKVRTLSPCCMLERQKLLPKAARIAVRSGWAGSMLAGWIGVDWRMDADM
jgi:hypothetical protein